MINLTLAESICRGGLGTGSRWGSRSRRIREVVLLLGCTLAMFPVPGGGSRFLLAAEVGAETGAGLAAWAALLYR